MMKKVDVLIELFKQFRMEKQIIKKIKFKAEIIKPKEQKDR